MSTIIDAQEKKIKAVRRSQFLSLLRRHIILSAMPDDVKDDLLHILNAENDNEACYMYWKLDSEAQVALMSYIYLFTDVSDGTPPEEMPALPEEYTVSLTKNEIYMMRDALRFWAAIQSSLARTHLKRISQNDMLIIDSALGKLPRIQDEEGEE